MQISKTSFVKIMAVGIIIAGLKVPAVAQAKPSMKEIKAASTPMQVVSNSRLVSEQKAAVFVNGRAVNWDGGKLLQSKGEIYVPLKPLVEAAKLTATHDLTAQNITLQRENRLIRVSQSSSAGQTLVPLRFATENLGGTMKVIAPTPQNGNITEVYITLSGQQGSGKITTIRSEPLPQGRVVSSISEAVQHNLKGLNAYRAKVGAPALKLDTKLNEFALEASKVLLKNHKAHHHFSTANTWASGFTGGAAENQGDPNGWTLRGSLNITVDDILKAMFDEGLGGGHHDNMMNPDFRRVGIGLVVVDNKLYLTNDFSK